MQTSVAFLFDCSTDPQSNKNKEYMGTLIASIQMKLNQQIIV